MNVHPSRAPSYVPRVVVGIMPHFVPALPPKPLPSPPPRPPPRGPHHHHVHHSRKRRFIAHASIERAKELTKQITAAEDWRDVKDLLSEDDVVVNLRHLTTAMYFLTKKNRARLAHDGPLLETLADVAHRIAQSDEPWSSASLANVLQACSHLSIAGPAVETTTLATITTTKGTNAFDELRSVALGHLAAGLESPLSNIEFLTILSCMVHVPDSSVFPEKAAATAAMEAALAQGDRGPVRLRTKGLEGFHPRDLGPLSWALTEVKCTESTAQGVFDHCMSVVGASNLSASALCLACRMISMQGARDRAEDNLKRIMTSTEHESVLQRLSSLRDSTMLLLAVARLIKCVCEDDVRMEESLSFGVKWTFAVVSYRKSHPSIDRLVNVLCMFVKRALSSASTSSSAMSSTRWSSKSAEKPTTSEVSHSVYSSILYSLALLQYPSSDVITACSRGLTLPAHKKKLTLRTISTCTWSLAVLRYEEPHVMRMFAKRIVAGRLLQSSRNGGRKHRDEKDLAQSVSMLLYGFAVLNLLDDSADARADARSESSTVVQSVHNTKSDMAALLATLMGVARSCLEHLGPEALPVFGWSIVIAHSRAGSMDNVIFEGTMRAWRQAVADSFADIPVHGRPMIHHTEIALSLEAPKIKGVGETGDLPFESLMELLYASGRLRRQVLCEWNAQSRGVALEGISLFQKQVYGAAERVCPGWQMEFWDDRLQYPVDMALPERRIVVEVDGPTHFMTNANRPLGATALKRRLLKRLGWRLVIVPYFEWSIDASDDEHEACMRAKLECILSSAPVMVDEESTHPTHPIRTIEAVKESSGTLVPTVDMIKSNASKLDAIRARQGKLSVKEAVRRRIFRAEGHTLE